MNAFNKRFFVPISLIFLGFSALSLKLKILFIFPIFALFLLILFLISSKINRKGKNFKIIVILVVCAAILGVFCSQMQILKNERLEDRYVGAHRITGYVKDVLTNQNFISEYVVRVESVDGKRAGFDLVLVTDYLCDLSRGDFFALDGKILPLEDYEEGAYLKSKNAYDYPLVCAIDDGVQIDYLEKEFRISLMLSGLNSRLSSTLKALLGNDAGEMASALLLGNRELLSDGVLRDFGRAGVYHMLALSGLHVAILIGILDWLLKSICVMRAPRLCILTLLSLFYIALTGFALSACRSMLMLWVMYLALTLGRKRDAMVALFLAVTVIVMISPSSVFDVGLQLSFLSTFGVISAAIISRKLRLFKRKGYERGIKSVVLSALKKLALTSIASLCVFISTLPLLMICFGEVSLATFISNLFMGIICEAFMVLSLITLLLSWSVPLRVPFAELSEFVGDSMQRIVSAIADIEGIMLSLSYPLIEILVWGLFLGFLILLTVRISRKWMIFVPSIAFAILLPINIAIYGAVREDFVRAEYLQKDTLVLSSSDEVYIVDMSNGSYGGFYDGVVLAKENCFTEIDGIILTHYHSKHAVSLERLAKNEKIHRVLLPKPQSTDEDLILRSIVRVLSGEGVEVFIYENDRELDILSGKLAISPRAYISGYAHPSVALSFAYGNERITLLGRPYFDTYLEESGIFEDYIKDSDYLILCADGRDPEDDFEIFDTLKNGCEISFSDYELMSKSDFEKYINKYRVYFNVNYKKYDLK